MQRLLTQPALRRSAALPASSLVQGYALRAAPLASELHHAHTAPSAVGVNSWAAGKRAFGSERKKWSPRCKEDTEEPVTVAKETLKDGPQLIEFWENEAGTLVAQYDELDDIESCRWAIRCVCERLRQPGSFTLEQKLNRMLALRFLLDLEDRIEQLSDQGYGTCAIDIFERPWVLECNDGTEILRFRPRPDTLLKRMMFAAMSPVIAPAGALLTYVKSGSTNSMAQLKWYFRAIMEMPTTVQLDDSYRVEGSYTDLEACAAASSPTFSDLRKLISVQQAVPQLAF